MSQYPDGNSGHSLPVSMLAFADPIFKAAVVHLDSFAGFAQIARLDYTMTHAYCPTNREDPQ